MGRFLFTSESVAVGHPDKVADQIADAVLDQCLLQDPLSRVACEVLVASGVVILAGEITTQARLDYQQIARDTICEIGYTDGSMGFDFRSCGVLQTIHSQSPDIASGIDRGEEVGAGDQGMMFGFACLETPSLMPLPIMLSHAIVRSLKEKRESKALPYLCPDGKAQVTVEYKEVGVPTRVDTVVLSAHHREGVSEKVLEADLKRLICDAVPDALIDRHTRFFINPAGRFVVGGPVADCGLTGRKTVVDTYGGMAHLGGGAFSGKDPTKVDRSAAYAGRYVAKNLVASGIADRCELQVSYAIGRAAPTSIRLDFFGTGKIEEQKVAKELTELFDLTPLGIIRMLRLQRPIYRKTAFGGHFGFEGDTYSWERLDHVPQLQRHFLR